MEVEAELLEGREMQFRFQLHRDDANAQEEVIMTTTYTFTYLDETLNLRTTHIKQRCLFVFLVLFCCLLIFHFYCDQEFLLFNRNLRIFTFRSDDTRSKLPSDYLIKQNGCRIPAMFTLGPLVDSFLEKIPSTQCDIRIENHTNSSNNTRPSSKIWKPALFIEYNNTLQVDKAALKYYGEKNLSCEYEEFFRSDPSSDDNDISFSEKKEKVYLDKWTNISQDTEFIRVRCHRTEKLNTNRQEIYKDFFAFVPLKKDVEKRCFEMEKAQSEKGINVMIIALDALSRLNFHRQMMMSSHYLKNEMHGIEMMGYNKVGDNTFPNFIPMFVGQSVDELKKTCWPTANNFFDDCPFVWQYFKKFGYRTNFAEDSSIIGVFNYLKNGFQKQPTDYYLRPFNIQAEFENGHTKPGNCFLCVGSKLNLALLLDYAIKFGEKLRDKKYFGLFWSSSFTHDFFNLSPQGDNAVLTFLQHLHRNNLLDNTMLMFVSDHGLRWGSFRETFQGHLEERLPMLWFMLPRWFEKTYPSAVRNLRSNADKLTTPFDFYETLLDLANLTRIENTEIRRRTGLEHFAKSRQTSLFLPVSTNRTCIEAGITKHYCTCHNEVKAVKTNDTIVVEGANAIVDYINELLKDTVMCARLNLLSIEAASVETSSMNEKREMDVDVNSTANYAESSYVITVKTTPGGGVFEASVMYEAAQRVFLVIGSVSRINTYGNRGDCINDYILRLFCYCF